MKHFLKSAVAAVALIVAAGASFAADYAIMAPAAPGGGGLTVEALAEAALRPMLKQWLDANLPALVERMVAREIARITGGGR